MEDSGRGALRGENYVYGRHHGPSGEPRGQGNRFSIVRPYAFRSKVSFYKKQKRKGAAFEIIYISSDKNEDAMAKYMNDYKMPWPAFEFGENKDIVSRNGNGIPNLIVTDANGKKLHGSYNSSGKYVGPTSVMKKLEELLSE